MPRRKPPPEPERPPRRARGTGSIVVLKNGTIRARLPANLDPQRTAKEFPPGHMIDAVAWLDGYLHPQPVAVVVVTLGEWTGTWHETYVEPLSPRNTARWYLYALQQLHSLYSVPLVDLRPTMLQSVVGHLAGRVAASTVLPVVGVWRRCLDAAVADDLLPRNPAARLTLPRSAPRQVKRHVTPAEVAALWPSITGTRFEAAYALLLGCGLRIGEVLGLAWEHVDFKGGRIWVKRQWTNSHWRDLPKGRVPRWVNLPPRVLVALMRHQQRQPAGATLVMQSPFVNHFGPNKRKRKPEIRPYAPLTVGRELRAICDQLKLDDMTPHAFRRGLATALLDGKASPAIVAERLGHADPSTTLRSYAGKSDEARQQADALIDAYLGADPESEIAEDPAV